MEKQINVSEIPDNVMKSMIIQISSSTFGKATKPRLSEPSMFSILSWENSLNSHDFKKDKRFNNNLSQAYLQTIQKNQWLTETKQNYNVKNINGVQVNSNTFKAVEEYLHTHTGPDNIKVVKPKIKNQENDNSKEKRPQTADNKNSKQKNNYKQVFSKKDNKTINDQKKTPKQDQAKSYQLQRSIFGNITEKNQLTETEQQKQKMKLINKFKQTTRWLPNSAFTTYFGKPAFQNYGCGNTNPTQGGLTFGTYLYSHNVQPHRGQNSPKYIQSYATALSKAFSQGTLKPSPPKIKNRELTQTHKQKSDYINIYPTQNKLPNLQIQTPILSMLQRFGGNGIPKVEKQSRLDKALIRNSVLQGSKLKKAKVNKNKINNFPTKKQNYDEWINIKQQENETKLKYNNNEIKGRKIN